MSDTKKRCPKGKIVNPQTKRCVKKDGKVAQAILSKKKPAPTKKTKHTAPTKDVPKTSTPQTKPVQSKTSIKMLEALVPLALVVPGIRITLYNKRSDDEHSIMVSKGRGLHIKTFSKNKLVARKYGLTVENILARIKNTIQFDTIYLTYLRVNPDCIMTVWSRKTTRNTTK